jgi:hypothetical protein
MFDATPQSLGQHTIGLQRQSVSFPEKVRWNYGPVAYVGLNVPGSDNNAPQFDATGKQKTLTRPNTRHETPRTWLGSTRASRRRPLSTPRPLWS